MKENKNEGTNAASITSWHNLYQMYLVLLILRVRFSFKHVKVSCSSKPTLETQHIFIALTSKSYSRLSASTLLQNLDIKKSAPDLLTTYYNILQYIDFCHESFKIRYVTYRMYSNRHAWTSTVDSDQTPQISTSDQSLHYFPHVCDILRHKATGSNVDLFKV